MINANITHSYYYENSMVKTETFIAKTKAAFPDAVVYNMKEEMQHEYLRDMQIAENFLHGAGQTYEVCRILIPSLTPIMEKSSLDGWCVMLAYFPESNVSSVSVHYSVKDVERDELIALRQSGEHRQYEFENGKFSPMQITEKVCAALSLPTKISERSYLCEITKIGSYNTTDEVEEKELKYLYGVMTGDEGYEFVPDELVSERLSHSWSSRNFIRIYAFAHSFVFLNLMSSEKREAYLERQTYYGTKIYGSCNPYFYMGESPLTVNHGIMFSVEFVMMLKALINNVLSYQSEYMDRKKQSYYKRIRMTHNFRQKIVMVLEKVERVEISEIGELTAVLLDSQHISPIIDQVKYLLELLESDLELVYSERNNLLVTALTVLGVLIALWQVALEIL